MYLLYSLIKFIDLIIKDQNEYKKCKFKNTLLYLKLSTLYLTNRILLYQKLSNLKKRLRIEIQI